MGKYEASTDRRVEQLKGKDNRTARENAALDVLTRRQEGLARLEAADEAQRKAAR
jgi:hypothetical protein